MLLLLLLISTTQYPFKKYHKNPRKVNRCCCKLKFLLWQKNIIHLLIFQMMGQAIMERRRSSLMKKDKSLSEEELKGQFAIGEYLIKHCFTTLELHFKFSIIQAALCTLYKSCRLNKDFELNYAHSHKVLVKMLKYSGVLQ